MLGQHSSQNIRKKNFFFENYKTFFQGGFLLLFYRLWAEKCAREPVYVLLQASQKRKYHMVSGLSDFISDITYKTAKSSCHKSCGSRNIIQVSRKVERQIDKIVLLQCDNSILQALFDLLCITKQMRQSKFYQKVQQVVITKCIRYCKVRQLLQSET